jgi:hypothetical protein
VGQRLECQSHAMVSSRRQSQLPGKVWSWEFAPNVDRLVRGRSLADVRAHVGYTVSPGACPFIGRVG